jgi:Tfp pilus assembly protein PilN
VTGEYLCALGAALGADGSLEAMLLPDPLVRRIRQRRLTRVSLSAAVCLMAFLLALRAIDRSRERGLQRLRDEIAALETRARPAAELSDRLVAIDREREALREIARQRPNPLRVLQLLGERLPAGATVLNVRAQGDEWQIDGRAPDAAAIVPLLDGDERLDGVHFLSASSRFREGNRTYETFSIAFRVRPEA